MATIQTELTKYLGMLMLIRSHRFQLTDLQALIKDISELLEFVLKNSWRNWEVPREIRQARLSVCLYCLVEFYTKQIEF